MTLARLLPTFAPRLPQFLAVMCAAYLAMLPTNSLVWPRSLVFALMSVAALLEIAMHPRAARGCMAISSSAAALISANTSERGHTRLLVGSIARYAAHITARNCGSRGANVGSRRASVIAAPPRWRR